MTLIKESEPQKETTALNCVYCGPGYSADWEIISDKGQEFVCGGHHFVLDEIHAIEKERPLCETEWKTNPRYGAGFEDEDQGEDDFLICL